MSEKEKKRVSEGEKREGGKRSVTLGAYNLLAMQYFLPVSFVCFTQHAAGILVARHGHVYRGGRSCLIRFGFQLDKF